MSTTDAPIDKNPDDSPNKQQTVPDLPEDLSTLGQPKLIEMRDLLPGFIVALMLNNQFDDARKVARHLRRVVEYIRDTPCECPKCVEQRAKFKLDGRAEDGSLLQ